MGASPCVPATVGVQLWAMLDFYQVSQLFTPEERHLQATVRDFLEAEAIPHIAGWWEQGTFPEHLVSRFGELGLIGATFPKKYGAAELSSVGYGLIMYELERVDSALRSFVSVQGLVMYPIYTYGSERQVKQYLPALVRGEKIGCFGLTEPEGGSDPRAMRTRAHMDGDTWVLNGTKMWISSGDIADIAIVWAKDDEGLVRGFIVPTDTPGFQVNVIKHKMSLRAATTTELVLKDVRIPATQMLPKAEGLSAPLACLTLGRYGIAWGVLGALEAVYSEALAFAQGRVTFGKPIGSRQLVQAKLAEMLSDHTRGLLLAWRLGGLRDEGKLTIPQVSLAKRDNARAALKAARMAREILGASGITMHHNAIRHMLNLETVDTYEGTHDIHTLILGRDITGLDAIQ